MSPSNKDRTSKCGAYKKSDHNLVATRFKTIWSKYANSETMKTCIFRVYTMYIITVNISSYLEN